MASLHIIRRRDDHLAMEAVSFEAGRSRVAVLLIQDAVASTLASLKPVYACEPDLRARGLESPHAVIGYDRIGQLLSEYDRIIVW